MSRRDARSWVGALLMVLAGMVGLLVIAVGVVALVWHLHDPPKATPAEAASQEHEDLCVLGLFVNTGGRPATKVLDESRSSIAYARANDRFGLPDLQQVPPNERHDVAVVRSTIHQLARRQKLSPAQVTSAEAAAGRVDAWVATNCPAGATSTTSYGAIAGTRLSPVSSVGAGATWVVVL